MKLLHLTLGLTFLLPLIASAGEYWRFETGDGVVSFVDDAKKIPEKYRDSAVRQEANGLDTYARTTVASARRTPPPPPAPEPAPELLPQVSGGVVMRVPDRAIDESPRYIRTKEYRWVDGGYADEGPFGAPGEVYALVEVVRDADGEIVSVDLHDPDTVHVVSDR